MISIKFNKSHEECLKESVGVVMNNCLSDTTFGLNIRRKK